VIDTFIVTKLKLFGFSVQGARFIIVSLIVAIVALFLVCAGTMTTTIEIVSLVLATKNSLLAVEGGQGSAETQPLLVFFLLREGLGILTNTPLILLFHFIPLFGLARSLLLLAAAVPQSGLSTRIFNAAVSVTGARIVITSSSPNVVPRTRKAIITVKSAKPTPSGQTYVLVKLSSCEGLLLKTSSSHTSNWNEKLTFTPDEDKVRLTCTLMVKQQLGNDQILGEASCLVSTTSDISTFDLNLGGSNELTLSIDIDSES
jgi:hypothetical protein